jgi:hypothetical protein
MLGQVNVPEYHTIEHREAMKILLEKLGVRCNLVRIRTNPDEVLDIECAEDTGKILMALNTAGCLRFEPEARK